MAAPDIIFVAADGSEHHLADFAGHGMVINLWATWCVPCVAEMPSLAALSKTLAPDDIAVLPLSSDRGGARRCEAFYQEHEITGLPVLLDPKGGRRRTWQVRGIPTSLIIDKQGRERARLEGAADWATPAAAAMVRGWWPISRTGTVGFAALCPLPHPPLTPGPTGRSRRPR